MERLVFMSKIMDKFSNLDSFLTKEEKEKFIEDFQSIDVLENVVKAKYYVLRDYIQKLEEKYGIKN